MNATSLLQDLIRCASVTPVEGGALALLEHVLKPAGFLVDRPVFSDEGTPDVENLFATIGEGKAPISGRRFRREELAAWPNSLSSTPTSTSTT